MIDGRLGKPDRNNRRRDGAVENAKRTIRADVGLTCGLSFGIDQNGDRAQACTQYGLSNWRRRATGRGHSLACEGQQDRKAERQICPQRAFHSQRYRLSCTGKKSDKTQQPRPIGRGCKKFVKIALIRRWRPVPWRFLSSPSERCQTAQSPLPWQDSRPDHHGGRRCAGQRH